MPQGGTAARADCGSDGSGSTVTRCIRMHRQACPRGTSGDTLRRTLTPAAGTMASIQVLTRPYTSMQLQPVASGYSSSSGMRRSRDKRNITAASPESAILHQTAPTPFPGLGTRSTSSR